MESLQNLNEILVWLIPLLIVLSIWDAIWKLIALWKSAKNNHRTWFIWIGITNSVGILPIIYILLQRKKSRFK